jgi:hypothetical protein
MNPNLPETIEIGDDVIFQILDDEVVLLNIASSQYYGLDPLGAEVWKLLLEHRSTGVVVERLCAKYQVDPDTARSDLGALIQSLNQAGLVRAAA